MKSGKYDLLIKSKTPLQNQGLILVFYQENNISNKIHSKWEIIITALLMYLDFFCGSEATDF